MRVISSGSAWQNFLPLMSWVDLEMKSWVDLEMKIKIRVCSILPATYLLKNLCMVRNSSVSLCDAQCEDYPHFIQVWIPPSVHPSVVRLLVICCMHEGGKTPPSSVNSTVDTSTSKLIKFLLPFLSLSLSLSHTSFALLTGYPSFSLRTGTFLCHFYRAGRKSGP